MLGTNRIGLLRRLLGLVRLLSLVLLLILRLLALLVLLLIGILIRVVHVNLRDYASQDEPAPDQQAKDMAVAFVFESCLTAGPSRNHFHQLHVAFGLLQR